MLTFNVADFPPSSVDPDGPSLPGTPPMGWGRFIWATSAIPVDDFRGPHL
jgi:hypothetical protein